MLRCSLLIELRKTVFLAHLPSLTYYDLAKELTYAVLNLYINWVSLRGTILLHDHFISSAPISNSDVKHNYFLLLLFHRATHIVAYLCGFLQGNDKEEVSEDT